MKKTIAILLALMLLLTGCSGGSEPQPGTVEQTPNVTEAAADSTLETLAPTEAPAQEAQVSLGRMEGGVYTNTYAGFGCELDSNWTFYTAEELQELPENTAELFKDSDLLDSEDMLSQITDMMAENVNDLTSINVLYTKLSMAERLAYAAMTDEEILDVTLEQKDAMIAAYEQAGFQVDSMEKVTVSFLGEECPALHCAMSIDGIAYYTLQVFNYKVGQYGITTTLASYLEDNTAGLLDLFYVVG